MNDDHIKAITQLRDTAQDYVRKLDGGRLTSGLALTWEKREQEIENAKRALENPEQLDKKKLRTYATKIARGARYIISKLENNWDSEKGFNSRYDFLMTHLRHMIDFFNAFTAQTPVNNTQRVSIPTVTASPTPQKAGIFRPGKHKAKAKKLPGDKQVLSLLKGKNFKKLEGYHSNTLSNDRRDHTFLFGTRDFRVEKSIPLTNLLSYLRQAIDIDDLADRLDRFYRGEGVANTTYDILNRGQNVTTRVLGLRTTTMTHIDNFRDEVMTLIDNANAAEEAVYEDDSDDESSSSDLDFGCLGCF